MTEQFYAVRVLIFEKTGSALAVADDTAHASVAMATGCGHAQMRTLE